PDLIGLDSNILLRWLVDDPGAPEQSELVRVRLEQTTESLYINHLVLAETVWVLREAAKLSPSIVVDIVSGLIDAPTVKLQEPAVVERALASFIANPGGFADHLIGE